MDIINIFSPLNRPVKRTPQGPGAAGAANRLGGWRYLASVFAFVLLVLWQSQAAQGAIVFESVSTATQDDKDIDSISIGLPIGAAADDLLLATIATKKTDNNTGAASVSAPAGWTQINQGANIDHVALAIFYKIAGVSESGPYVFTVDSNVEEIAGAILRYSGVDTGTPVDVSDAQNDDDNGGFDKATPTSPSVTTTFADTMVVRIFGQKDNDNPATPPTGTTERVEIRDAGDKVTLGVADATQAAAGATGNGVFSGLDSKEWRAATVALVPLQVELAIDKATSTPTVNAGGQADYSVVVSNTGGATATGVTVSDTLPSGFTFASGSVAESSATRTGTTNPSVDDSTLNWGTWDINAGGSIVISFTVNVTASTPGGTYNNIAAASATNHATVLDDGTDTDEDVTVLDADLSVTKTVNNAYPNEGDNIVYTITATNNGGGDATGVTVTDTLPAGVTWVSTVPSQGGCSAPSGVTCELGSIANGNGATVIITATVNSGLGDSAMLTNTASVSADQNDPVSGNDTDTADATTCPANHLHNIASVTSGASDPDPTNNSDHICTEVAGRDFGDAPASYGEASHTIRAVSEVYLGGTVDADEGNWVDGVDDNESATDDDDPVGVGSGNGDDEDGVSFSSPPGGGDNIIANVIVTNNTVGPVSLHGWLDVNVDGVFQASERRSATVPNGGTSTVDLAEWIVSSTATQIYFSRFRICSVSAECDAPSGTTSASDGEVEDYGLFYNPTAVIIGEVELSADAIEQVLAELGADRETAPMLALLEEFDPALAHALADASGAEIEAALIDYLDPDGDGHVAILRWNTLQERGTIGFYVERREGETGNWQRLNGGMLPGLIDAPLGGEYWLADPAALPGEIYQYLLIELEAWGTQRNYGPWTLSLPE